MQKQFTGLTEVEPGVGLLINKVSKNHKNTRYVLENFYLQEIQIQ